jgi:hypothetical protein
VNVEVSRLGLLGSDAVYSGKWLLKLWMNLLPKCGGDPINNSISFLLNLYPYPPVRYIREDCDFFYNYIREKLKFQNIKPTVMKSKKCLFKLSYVSI